MTSRIGAAAIRILALALFMFLAIFYLRLGYFALFLHGLGAVGAVLLTRRQRTGFPAIRSSLVAVLGYCAALVLVLSVAVRNRSEVHDIAWEIDEQPGHESRVVLPLGGGDAFYSASTELRDYVTSRATPTVTVSLTVTRILGCFQGVGEPSIEGFGVIPRAEYESSSGAGPHGEHWWCP